MLRSTITGAVSRLEVHTGAKRYRRHYAVDLRFAEIQNKKPGQRQSDVIVNGARYLNPILNAVRVTHRPDH
jgi:hypothetical protein